MVRLLRLAAVPCLLACFASAGSAAAPPAASKILQELRAFKVTGRVLFVAAHPDDENTQLIAYLDGGRHYRTAYLSLTRGDGGQNVLGPEFGEELGVIRTQELLAARRIDGGHQFFTRAIDFGFSKNPQETLRIWNRREVLSDVVRVIREFRPDIIITRFSPTAGRTHGHHTASAVLALEAFKLAGKPDAFPEQLKDFKPWQPKRILWNVGWFRPSQSDQEKMVQIDAGGVDPATGGSFADIAAKSRSMHKTQGFGDFRGGRGDGPRPESFLLLDGAPVKSDILDGVDTSWNRFAGGAEIGRMTDELLEKFDTNSPAQSVPALLKIRSSLAALSSSRIIEEKKRLLDRILAQCLGLRATTTLPRIEVVPGETMKLRHTATLRSSAVPVRWLAVRYPALGTQLSIDADLSPDRAVSREDSRILPADTPPTQPYWLRAPHPTGTYTVKDPELIGRPENPPAFPIEQVFKVGEQELVISEQPVQAGSDPASGAERRLAVISPVSLQFSSSTALFAPGASSPVSVEITAARANLSGSLELKAPEGWKVAPESRSFELAEAGAHQRLAFTVTAPSDLGSASITASALVNGRSYDNQRIVIDYPHIPMQLLQPPAELKAVCLQLATRGRRVGYIPGAGDSVADALQAMGYAVSTLSGADLTPERMKQFDAVVVGVRAFNVRDDLAPHMAALFSYIEAGGNLIEQYNRPNGLKTGKLAPYELHLSSERVTDEAAPMTLLRPSHPALTTPNKITPADFEGWVQEQGIYYPDRWDDHFTPLLESHDPGEEPLKGGLLVAPYGKGYFVYTGLVFFRQLPAGVPGAYRLFANLVSLGK